MTPDTDTRRRRAMRVVALFEAAKGALVLLAASGMLALVHQNLHLLAARLIEHLHLNPASRAPAIFVDAMSHLDDQRLLMLAAGAAAYAVARLAEGWGLFHERAWAEWLAAASGAIYVPFEVVGLWRDASWLHVVALAINLAVVALMAAALQRRRAAVRASVDARPRV